MRTDQLPPVPSESERQELSELTAFLRHEAVGNRDDGSDDEDWKLRLAELVDLFVADAEQWAGYRSDQ